MLTPKKAVNAVPALLLLSLLSACSSNNETADTLITNQSEAGSDLETAVPELGAAIADNPVTTDDTLSSTDNVDSTNTSEPAAAQANPAEPVTANAEPAVTPAPQVVATPAEETIDETVNNTDQEPTIELIDAPVAAAETPAILNDATYESASTEGFTGRVSGNNVELKWAAAPGARGYNVYRAGEYLTTVSEPSFTDNNLSPDSYYYEIDSFDNNDSFDQIADALTVYVGVPNLTGPNQEHPLPQHIVDDYQL